MWTLRLREIDVIKGKSTSRVPCSFLNLKHHLELLSWIERNMVKLPMRCWWACRMDFGLLCWAIDISYGAKVTMQRIKLYQWSVPWVGGFLWSPVHSQTLWSRCWVHLTHFHCDNSRNADTGLYIPFWGASFVFPVGLNLLVHWMLC